jgi:transcriptional regulator with XRE-family HTH domain
MPWRFYQSLEAGNSNPTLLTLSRLAKGFMVDPLALLGPPADPASTRSRARKRKA